MKAWDPLQIDIAQKEQKHFCQSILEMHQMLFLTMENFWWVTHSKLESEHHKAQLWFHIDSLHMKSS